MKKITIEHDNDALDIIDGVNSLLEPHGIKFIQDGQEHDGFEIFEMTEPKPSDLEPKFLQLKEVIKKAPLSYYQGRLLKTKDATDQDVIAWLAKLNKLVE